MKFAITKSEDIDEAREVHKQTFPDDPWVGDDHEYWFATDEAGSVVAFATAVYSPASQSVYLSRCGVLPEAAGHGLQRKFIRARSIWARGTGAKFIFTYTSLKNYPSMVSLIRSDFRMIKPKAARAWRSFHIFVKVLYVDVDIKAAVEKAAELIG